MSVPTRRRRQLTPLEPIVRVLESASPLDEPAKALGRGVRSLISASGLKGLLSGTEAEYLKQIGADEDAHVAALTSTITKLGGTPVAAPGVDFKDSFSSRASFLQASYTFENTGVSAYLGAAGFIKSKDILQAAAGIFGVEARHAAVVGNLLGLPPEGGVFKGATETPLPKAQVLQAVSPYITK